MADNNGTQSECAPHAYTTPTPSRGFLNDFGATISDVVKDVEKFVKHGSQDNTPELWTFAPHDVIRTMHIRYNGEDRDVGPGYRQSGVITSVQDGIVTQNTGRGTVQYSANDLTEDARPGSELAMQDMLIPGRNITVSVGAHLIHVASNDLECAQQHAVEHAR